MGFSTGHLVKALVKANYVLQKIIKEEIKSAHIYAGAIILKRLKNADKGKSVDDIKAKIKEEFTSMVDIDVDCTSSEGVVWLANNALRVAEKYRELYARADVMDICGLRNNEVLNKTCADIIARYERAVRDIELRVRTTIERLSSIYEGTATCLRSRYDTFLKGLETKSF